MFGSMFNDIDVVRYDKQGNRVQGITRSDSVWSKRKVPC